MPTGPSLLTGVGSHLAIIGGDPDQRALAAKLELVRQLDAGAAVSALSPAGRFNGLAEPHQRQLAGPGGVRVPLLCPPAPVSPRTHLRTITPWLLSLAEISDPLAGELLELAIARAYGTYGIAGDRPLDPVGRAPGPGDGARRAAGR